MLLYASIWASSVCITTSGQLWDTLPSLRPKSFTLSLLSRRSTFFVSCSASAQAPPRALGAASPLVAARQSA